MPRTLHLCYRTTVDTALADWLQASDTLVLLGDGIYALPSLPTTLQPGTLCVLHEDAQARGLAGGLPDHARPINMAELVQLVVEHERSLSWN